MKTLRGFGFLFCIVAGGRAQTLPLVQPVSAPAVRSGNNLLAPKACNDQGWIPFRHETSDDCFLGFYAVGKGISMANQVQFLYGFGQDSKTLSADLVTAVFRPGINLALGSSVTSGGSGAPAGSGDTKDTPTQAIERLKAGGDFYVRATYPLYARGWGSETRPGNAYLIVVPKLGFSFSGFGSEATITEATEYNVNVSTEGYAEQSAIGNTAAVFGTFRTGYQYVRPEFAQQVGLGGKNNFFLGQFAFGIKFGNLMRIGFQRFVGPEAALGTTKDELGRWHLVLQFIR